MSLHSGEPIAVYSVFLKEILWHKRVQCAQKITSEDTSDFMIIIMRYYITASTHFNVRNKFKCLYNFFQQIKSYCNVRRKIFNIVVIIFLWDFSKRGKGFHPKNY